MAAFAGSENRFGYWRLLCAAFLTIAGLATSTTLFAYLYQPECSAVASWKYCEFAKHFGERCIAGIVLFGIYLLGRRAQATELLGAVQGPGSVSQATMLTLVGTSLVVIPAALIGASGTSGALLGAIIAWTIGVICLTGAVLRLIAPWSIWWTTLKSGGVLLITLLLVAISLPEIGDTLFPLWHIDLIRQPTFAAVVQISHWIGLTLEQDSAEYILGQGDFFVRVNQSCSGIEGFVLTTVFLLGYAAIFSRQVRVGRVLMALPLALAISWCLNVLRIALLIWLGVNVSPTLAVEGFHSHAGWLMFSVLAMGLIGVISLIPWFQKAPAAATGSAPAQSAPLPPLSQDWNAARILPFAVFMFSALLASTFFQHPALAYPVRLLLMLGALWMFRGLLLRLAWRLDRTALGAGLIIGAGWILSAGPAGPDSGLTAALAALGWWSLALWATARIIGTTIAVPIIEELFFRSYLLEKLIPRQTALFVILGVVISTITFAALHDRWIAAGLPGLIFAWLALRKEGDLTDAILAHMVANSTIAAAAVINGNWAMI